MKIICIGRNYVNHAKELGNAIPEAPVLFIKPATALTQSNTFIFPSFSNEVHFELELVLKISKIAKNVTVEEAKNYYHQIGLGIDFTARDLQFDLKQNGLPWEKAKAFDGSAVVSGFLDISSMPDSKQIYFELTRNGEVRQQGNSKHMIYSFNEIIAHASRFFTLEEGDLIFTGTPEGVGPVEKNDILTGKLEGRNLLEVTVI